MNQIVKHRKLDIKNNVTIKIVAAYFVTYFVWGSTYLAIRYAIETIPPFLMAGFRFTIAGILFYGWCYLRETKKPRLGDWKRAAVSGILMVVCGNGMVTWSEHLVSSGFTSLIVATVPIWMVIIDWAQSSRNRPNRLTLAGIGLGLAGVALLSNTGNEILIDPTGEGGSVILGVFVLLFAAISWATGSLYSRNNRTTVSLQFTIGMQTIVGGIVLLSIGTLQGDWARISPQDITFMSLASLSYLILFGTLLAYSAYAWLLQVHTPAKVGTYAYFNPLVAIFLGGIFVDEPVTTQMLIGAGCILISLLMVNQLKFRRKQPVESIQHMISSNRVNETEKGACIGGPGIVSCCDQGYTGLSEVFRKTGKHNR